MNNSQNRFIWAIASTAEEPSTLLESWRALEVRLPTAAVPVNVHLVGRLIDRFEGRVSSAVRSVDGKTRQVVTKSSRVYGLIGPPGNSSDGDYVLEQWLEVNQGSVLRDVSDELYAELQRQSAP